MVEFSPSIVNIATKTVKKPFIHSFSEFVLNHDKDVGVARENLVDFTEQYFGFGQPQQEYTCIREYKANGTGFAWETDPVAKDSIIVLKIEEPGKQVISEFHYVSGNKVGILGEPMLYYFDFSAVTDISNFHEQNEGWRTRLKNELHNPKKQGKMVHAENFKWGSDKKMFDLLAEKFMVESHDFDKSHMSIEVWKRGSGSKSKVRKDVPIRRPLTSLEPVSLPNPV